MPYIKVLDGLRGIAILLVMISHIFRQYYPAGWIGVEIFFVLSGYLITNSILHSGSLKEFYKKRFLRLVPPLMFFIIVYLFFSYFLNIENSILLISSVLLFFSNWMFAFNLLPKEYLTHLWSLAVEEQFYLIWSIIIFYIKKKVFIYFLFFLTFVYKFHVLNMGVFWSEFYYRTDTRISSFILGSCLYFLIKNKTNNKFLINFFVFISLVFIIYFGINARVYNAIQWFFIINCSVALLIFFSRDESNVFNRFLSFKWLVYIGKISYGLYIWHYCIYKYLRVSLNLEPWYVLYYGTPIVLFFVLISYYFIEKPLLSKKS
ncbi:acyltransferase family protein [Acinetobacter haemolyticus]|uniref:Acyltransferase n=1 Tax=Acinetobacter haemolyticus TaxID=29430 RepID=A0A4P7B415_ACIHA|nr:acyltransferase [Acinetobacter haemolyticus]QBQ15040.1 acyltransferase [Acinetobacter haemolyticus]